MKNTFIHSRGSLENQTDLDKNGQNLYPFSDRNDAKTVPFGAADTYIALLIPHPPPSYLYSLKPS